MDNMKYKYELEVPSEFKCVVCLDDVDAGVKKAEDTTTFDTYDEMIRHVRTHIPVGPDQAQHIEMARDIAGRFNHTYKNIFTLPEAMIQDEVSVPGLDGRKMSKSYNNIIPFLCDEKTLQKSVSKIITNSLEPGEPKDSSDCNLFKLYSCFASSEEINQLQAAYLDGIGWGDAKKKLFLKINNEIEPIRASYFELLEKPQLLNELFAEGASKVRPQAKELLSKVRDAVGIAQIV